MGPFWGWVIKDDGTPPHHAMAFTIYTHDSWGVVAVGNFPSIQQAREAFSALCNDPWYQQDGTIKGLELVQDTQDGRGQRLDWLAFQ